METHTSFGLSYRRAYYDVVLAYGHTHTHPHIDVLLVTHSQLPSSAVVAYTDGFILWDTSSFPFLTLSYLCAHPRASTILHVPLPSYPPPSLSQNILPLYITISVVNLILQTTYPPISLLPLPLYWYIFLLASTPLQAHFPHSSLSPSSLTRHIPLLAYPPFISLLYPTYPCLYPPLTTCTPYAPLLYLTYHSPYISLSLTDRRAKPWRGGVNTPVPVAPSRPLLSLSRPKKNRDIGISLRRVNFLSVIASAV